MYFIILRNSLKSVKHHIRFQTWRLMRPFSVVGGSVSTLMGPKRTPLGSQTTLDNHRRGRNVVAKEGILAASSPQGKGAEAPWRFIIKQQAKRTAEIRHLAPNLISIKPKRTTEIVDL